MNQIKINLKNKENSSFAILNAVKGYNGCFTDVISEIEQYSLLVNEPIHKDFINYFLMFVENEYNSCAILSTLWVSEFEQGKGFGKELVQRFNDETKNIPFKFLFTRNKSKQKDDFDLELFYQKQGFVTIYKTDFENWMINSEQVENYKSFFELN